MIAPKFPDRSCARKASGRAWFGCSAIFSGIPVSVADVDSVKDLRMRERISAEALNHEFLKFQGRNVLAIRETWDRLSAGAMITADMIGETLRFDLDEAATEAAGLKVGADVVELSLSQGKQKETTP